MRKIICLFIAFLLIAVAQVANAKTDYRMLYDNAQAPEFELMHGVDPFQMEEYYKYAWAPYPLIRTASTLYFKNQTIPSGYYLLTPRKYKGQDWVFFKEAGKVKYIIPVVETQFVPADFYRTKIPIPKKTLWQKFCKSFSNGFYRIFRQSQKIPPPNAYIESKPLENDMSLIIVYFGNTAYYCVFQNSKVNAK